MLFQPQALHGSEAPDERTAARQKMLLKFVLPRGSYATIVVKRAFS